MRDKGMRVVLYKKPSLQSVNKVFDPSQYYQTVGGEAIREKLESPEAEVKNEVFLNETAFSGKAGKAYPS